MTSLTSLTCYRIGERPPALVPARAERAWMGATHQRFAYRCLPLSIANSMGWELLCPITFEAEWNGEAGLDAIALHADTLDITDYVASHFGHGVLSFMTYYLFRTEPGIGLSVRGSPNQPKDGIHPLDGFVETDWLDFPFTMNWMFTRPGHVRFEAGEPFCFITPTAYRGFEAIEPQIIPLAQDPELEASVQRYTDLRHDLNDRLQAGEPEALRQGWQKWYFRGIHPDGEAGPASHISKLRAAAPVFRNKTGYSEQPSSDTKPEEETQKS